MTGKVDDRVAVIVPNYNKAKTLRECLAAVYAQSYPISEVVVVDDASTDGSGDIARDFACTLIEQPNNRGVSAARNAGAAATDADLLFFVDSDIALAPDAVANAVRTLREAADRVMVYGIYDAEPLVDDGPVERYRTLFEHFWRRRAVGRPTATMFSLSLVPRTVFLGVGGLDEQLRHGEDIEFGTRLPAGYRTVMTDAVVGRHDDVDRLLPYLWEQFDRANNPQVLLKTWPRRHVGATGVRTHMMSAAGLLLTAGTLLALAVAALAPWLLVLVPLLLAGFLWANREFLRFAWQRKGVRFAVFAIGMHLLLHAAAGLGSALGLARAGTTILWQAGRRTRVDAHAQEVHL
jgi:cellulose synthase/poly-beta-1,6-N-acetylglucosamine synthase-like glycosyltransferase